jgi:hypothetical protein
MVSRISFITSVLLGIGLLIPPLAYTQDHSDPHAKDTVEFMPDSFERTTILQLYGTPQEVFALLEPEGRKLTSHEKIEASFFIGEGEPQPGEMFMSKHEFHGETWRVLAGRDPENLTISYVYFAPPTELLYREYKCEANMKGGTKVTVLWRVVGLSNRGNRAVRDYFESGDYERGMRNTEMKLNQLLNEKKK